MTTLDELALLTQKRIDCPLTWCAGRYFDHGGDGSPPELWTHASDDELMPAGALGAVIQSGSDPAKFTVELQLEVHADADELVRLSDRLRALADQLEVTAERVRPIVGRL